MSGTITIATERCEPKNVFGVRWHHKLVDVTMWIMDLTGEVVITSGRRYRTIHSGDSGIHLTDPLRALDYRYYIYNDPDHLVGVINSHWHYDPSRPNLKVAVLHDVGRGKHFHIQVHDNTREI